jgi:hypothetical protein
VSGPRVAGENGDGVPDLNQGLLRWVERERLADEVFVAFVEAAREADVLVRVSAINSSV